MTAVNYGIIRKGLYVLMRYDGNLAYNLSFEEHSAQLENKVREEKIKAKKTARAISVKNHKIIACCALVFALCAGFMISRNVTAYESQNEVKELQKELNGLKEYSSQKSFELDKSVDLESVEEIAKNKLNMVRPEKYQTVYVNIRQDDVTEVTADQVEGIKNIFGIFEKEK